MKPWQEAVAAPAPDLALSPSCQSKSKIKIRATHNTEPDGARQALEQLCVTYWYPIYACIRRHGKRHDQAESLISEHRRVRRWQGRQGFSKGTKPACWKW
jgi:hypothetical protein